MQAETKLIPIIPMLGKITNIVSVCVLREIVTVYFVRNRVIGQARLIVHAITPTAPKTQTV